MVQTSDDQADGDYGVDILLVEDEAILAMVAAEVLGDAGHRVQVAESAEEAMASLDAGFRPHLAIIDHGLPGMNGADLAACISERLPDTRILIASGDAGFAAPGYPALAKPYRDSELIERVAALLPSSLPPGSAS